MFRVLFLMILLFVGLVAAPYISGHQGYVRIETDTKVIEMSLVMLVVFFIVALSVIYTIEWAVTRFLRLNRNAYHWFSSRKRKKAQAETIEGLMEMSEGNYAKAEKLFSKNAKHADEPVLNLIKAAEAAQQKGDEFNANRYLLEASERAGGNSVIVELARTRILLQQGKLPAARSAVDGLLEIAPKNNEALRLAIQIYLESKAFHTLDRLLENINQRGFLSAAEYETLVHQVDDGLLDEIMNEDGQDGLLKWWEDQTSSRRKSVYTRAALIKRLIEVGDTESACEITLDTMKKYDDELLESLYPVLTALQVDDGSKLLKILQKRADKAAENYSDDYARALGYIYVRAGMYEKAKSYFVHLLDHAECVAEDRIMALHTAEKLNDIEMIERIRSINLQAVNLEDDSANQIPLLENKA